ncbi:hypothetical protein [Halorussus halophilus]|uniref:hypothetical protein n=1 Tax=Halorussus halophilus TaxID=2650975 RepID=UPI001300EB4C|nr:hypothetical protein [Halorussus halophilus]
MNWTKLLAALGVASLAFVVVGGLVELLTAIAGYTAALAVTALLVVVVLAAVRWGARSKRWRANPYW